MPPKPITTTTRKPRKPAVRAPASPPPPPPSPPPQPTKQPLTIPPALLTRILHSFFIHQDDSDGPQTRISSTAVSALSEYSRTFVREAIHRAAEERGREEKRRGVAVGGVAGEVFLEVEDLEKVGPQLVLDF